MAALATIGNGKSFYVNPDNPAEMEEASWETTRPKTADGEWWKTAVLFEEYTYNETAKTWTPTGKNVKKYDKHYTSVEDATAKSVSGEDVEWGAANITKEMFIDEQGKPRPLGQIYSTLDPLLPGITGDKLRLQIRDMLPKYTGVDPKEKEIEKQGFEADVYGVSKKAGEVADKARSAYGGMGTGMRGAIGAQKDIAQQFKGAEQAYEADIYGLEKKAGEAFEGDIAGSLDPSFFETGDEGIKMETWNWEEDYRKGGRVPNKNESFSYFLTQLPDAGGM